MICVSNGNRETCWYRGAGEMEISAAEQESTEGVTLEQPVQINDGKKYSRPKNWKQEEREELCFLN